MANKEATARIKINKLLEAAGWRFFPEGSAPANIRLEPGVTIKSADLDALGENFEKTTKGFIDFLLLDTKGFPLLVLEAKAEDKNPLVGKEQARKYAKSQNCRFVILSNGNLHYFWDLERGNPYVITTFPAPDSVIGYQQVTPNPQRLVEEELKFTEGRSTGIPKIIDALQANGSPPAEFDFGADHSYFMVRLPVHPAALEVADSEVGELADEDTPQVTPQVSRLLEVLIGEMSRTELMNALALKDRMHFANDYLRPALEEGLIQYTIPDKPK